MQKIFILTLASLISVGFLRGQVVLKGRIENLPPSINQIAVDCWSENSWVEKDRFEISKDHSFQKTVTAKYGQARLRLWGEPTHWLDFIVPENPSNDSILDFGTIDYKYIDGNPAKLKGKENEAYFQLLTDQKKYRILRDSLFKSDSIPAEAKTNLATQLEKARTQLNARCTEMPAQNKGSLTGDILANVFYVPGKSDYASDKNIANLTQVEFEREHLLDRLPLGDNRVLLHNGLIRALNQYSMKFMDADPSNYIIKVMSKRRGNEEVDTWLFKYLFQVSLNYKNDIALSYLVKWYSKGSLNQELNLDPSTQNLLTALRNCEVGKKAFNLSLPDVTGNTIRLSDIAAKNKLTLLLFWRTDCSHCLEFEPELEELYKRYKPLGLEVIGISIDQMELNWKNYMEKNPGVWTNLFPATRDLRIQVISNFPIPGTPTLIAVDNKFIVKNRMVIRNSIEKYLMEEFGN